MQGKSILLIIGGGIAAYKCLDLIRRLKERGVSVRAIITGAGEKFVTPLSVATLSGEQVFTELFDLKDETEIGHIQLSREADLIVVAPATADFMARMAQGLANDLASTVILASDKPILVAPAMNVQMWHKPATKRNVATLKWDGVTFVGPNEGTMACGEWGLGRMAEIDEILTAIDRQLAETQNLPLFGKRVLVTSGPTQEPIDPVRYISNRSSGKQGYAIAMHAARMGAETILISGPTHLPDPADVKVIHVETAREMLQAARNAMPVDIAVCAAAVADWRVSLEADQKIKKKKGQKSPPLIELVENPDILKTLSKPGPDRPRLVLGFAAETENVVPNAQKKLKDKGCDWVIANDVSEESGVFGGESNMIHLVTKSGVESWPVMPKEQIAKALMQAAAEELQSLKPAAE